MPLVSIIVRRQYNSRGLYDLVSPDNYCQFLIFVQGKRVCTRSERIDFVENYYPLELRGLRCAVQIGIRICVVLLLLASTVSDSRVQKAFMAEPQTPRASK